MFPVLDLVEVVHGARIASTRHAILPHRRQHHSLAEALLKATVLTAVSLLLRNQTLPVGDAGVHALVLHRPLEEALATLAGDDAVVEAGGAVFADHADHLLVVGVGRGGRCRSRRCCCR